MKNMKRKVIALASKLAYQESEQSGKDYYDCISNALDKVCEELGVSRREFIRMFL